MRIKDDVHAVKVLVVASGEDGTLDGPGEEGGSASLPR